MISDCALLLALLDVRYVSPQGSSESMHADWISRHAMLMKCQVPQTSQLYICA